MTLWQAARAGNNEILAHNVEDSRLITGSSVVGCHTALYTILTASRYVL